MAAGRGIGKVVLTVLTAAVMVAGCSGGAGNPKADAGRVRVRSVGQGVATGPVTAGDLLPSSRPLMEDLPVPMGFKLVESMSRHAVEGGVRRVEHVFDGRAERGALERFYGMRMGPAGWEATGRRLEEGGVAVLRYGKGTETCEVRIEPGLSGTGAVLTRVRYSVRPTDRAGG